jgi:hypothetical protein
MDVSKDPPQVLTKKGGYIDAAPYLIATFRLGADSNIPNNTTGFRCVVDR